MREVRRKIAYFVTFLQLTEEISHKLSVLFLFWFSNEPYAGNLSSMNLTRSDTYQPLQPQKITTPFTFEPRSEKTGLRGFRPGPTQTGLHSDRKWLEA